MNTESLYLVHVEDDVVPVIHGPFNRDNITENASNLIKTTPGLHNPEICDGLYLLSIKDGVPSFDLGFSPETIRENL